jgi:hypothetical protein
MLVKTEDGRPFYAKATKGRQDKRLDDFVDGQDGGQVSIADCRRGIRYDIMVGTLQAGHTPLEYATGLKNQ